MNWIAANLWLIPALVLAAAQCAVVKRQARLISHLTPFLLVTASLLISASAAELKVGFAVTDITPPVGWRMSGYFYERPSTGIHDPLQAKVIVLQQAGERAAFVLCDLIGVSREVSSAARRQASRKSGIPAEHILIAATHTHTGPLYTGSLREYFHEATAARFGRDFHEGVDYQAILISRLADAIVRASRSVQSARLEAGKALAPGISFNRRYHMKDGAVRFNPGKTNAEIVRPAGPVDPEVSALVFRDRKRSSPLGALISFPLHPDTVGGTEYGADYPFYIERTMKSALGKEFFAAFGNGTCGDINHINVNDPRPQKGHLEAQQIGTRLAGIVLSALPKLNPVTPSLAVRSTTFRFPLQQFTPAQIADARAKMPLVGGKQLPFLKQVEVAKITDVQLRGGRDYPLEVQVFRLGADTAVVGLPGEIFVELGLAIKKASPFRNTMVIELCNDCIGYVPTQKAFSEGSYETVNSRLQPGVGEALLESAVRLLKQLK